MTEQQQYRVTRTLDDDVELRHYAPCVMADVIVSGDYRRATYEGFRPLVTYISRNDIAMTAPVVQEGTDDEQWRVSFVMPAGTTLADLPVPRDGGVTLRNLAGHDAAAIRFSGIASRRDIVKQEQRLRESLRRAGIRPIGSVRIARFDPPWTPGFLRHNEIVIDVTLQP